MHVHSIAAQVHGRYLVDAPRGHGPVPVLVGFHGYAERGEHMLEVLQRIRGDRQWLLVSVQALNRFYTRTQEVVGNWMTREDRELAIADNIAYVAAVVSAVRREYRTMPHVVYAGFSQGVAMAYRALAFAAVPDSSRQSSAQRPAGRIPPGLKPGPAGISLPPGSSEQTAGAVFSGHAAGPPRDDVPAAVGGILLAGDVPPDVAPHLASLPPLLIGRGTADGWYTESKAAADLALFAAAGVSPQVHVFEGGHIWDESFITAAGQFLDRTYEPVNP